jgi:hypothetical protein
MPGSGVLERRRLVRLAGKSRAHRDRPPYSVFCKASVGGSERMSTMEEDNPIAAKDPKGLAIVRAFVPSGQRGGTRHEPKPYETYDSQ